MQRRLRLIWLTLLLCLIVAGTAQAAAENWTWIASDQKYGKFYAPGHVKVESAINGVATRISAWTKTVYSFGGAQETIANYGIEASIPDPRQLAYSLALVEVHPQTREIEYIQENFYNPDNKVIWSKVYETPRTVKEINSQSFDEDFYVVIVDAVFHHGERDRQQAPDRWITLWQATLPDGSAVNSMADTTTMRLTADNLVFWEWLETKDKAGNVIEVKFMKKALNAAQGSEKIIRGNDWTGAGGWQDMAPSLDGRYTVIPAGSPAEKGLIRLRAFIKGYQFWLNRYRTDSPSGRGTAKNDSSKNTAPQK
ncbi:MAG: hypothetical protein IJS96_07270 [Schwartzia sp.]|nr:hypothetical protein [Schwartzia sp. (in: firmicutes)]